MPQQPPEQRPAGPGLPDMLVALFEGLAYSVEVMFRTDIGERRVRRMGLPLLLTLGVALVLTAMTLPEPTPAYPWLPPDPHHDGMTTLLMNLGPWPMLGLCLLSLGSHAQQRYRAWRRRGQGGPPGHTYYDGTPNCLAKLRRRWPGLTEIQCKRWVEPAYLAVLGALALFSFPHVGLYFIAAAAAVHATVVRRLHQQREQALDTTDGVLDMLNHQEAVAAERNLQPQQQPAARVVASAPACAGPEPRYPESRPPAPAYSPPQPTPPTVAVPSRLRDGLNDNLKRLLDEPHVEQ